MTDRDFPTRTEGEGETLDMPEGFGAFTQGQVLGDRYQILEMLGRGGMGEVWHAFDLKLRVDVALKALREDFFKSERRLELLRKEVRAARGVVSPNVCRIFDLIEIEGRELVSMEYVDGATLLGVLQERGPLDLKEAQDIASQFLAGLEAIHKVGLIHRDIKPENIMLTRAGRVVVMDFGLARQETEGGGSVSGTPAYMAPEQAAGQSLDARADVYAAGVVLAEMVSPDGIKSYESRQSVWEGLRSEPAKVPDSPWAPVLKRAVAKDREGRFNTAQTLTRALEDVTLRVEGAEDLHPYPGLASFTQEDAEFFFGREAEVEQMWRKLEGPARMLALVGSSGAGKSSFIRAGLFATAPASWSFRVTTPGNAAISSLGRVMAREMAGDPDMVEKMMDFNNPDVAVEVLSRWRQRNARALLVVDQFEELFTQNAADEQRRFAELLNRLVLDADVCVVLSMRDDFLMRCRDFEALEPTFADMTALPSLSGSALRRALTRPATKCGYRFEDDELVEQMLAEVEGERGALPLLAFAAAQLWERRDRETGHLTRDAYQDIGGVGGALARHAEAIIDRIGIERLPIVRELFRNLVTADGTRSVREWNELLSVFEGESSSLSSRAERPRAEESRDPHRVKSASLPSSSLRASGDPSTRSSDSLAQDDRNDVAAEVLRELINARLLTSYEVREDEQKPTRRVEIIHESLLANWPRLVRWQTQDADGAQIRDELRQAAQVWNEHGQHDDRLWTGIAFREYQLWRERYPGGLTETEEAFAAATTSLATRQRRRRRVASIVGISILIAVLAVVTGLWRQGVRQTRRAEAQKLLTLGELQIEADPTEALALGKLRIKADPTEALAWARASLEVSDTLEGRLFALRALSKDPIARVLPLGGKRGVAHDTTFSPDGRWIALRGIEQLNVYRQRGGVPAFTDTFPTVGNATIWPFFDPSSTTLGAYKAGEIRTYSVPGFAEMARYEVDRRPQYPFQTDRGVFVVSTSESEGRIEQWRPGSAPELVTTTPPLGWPFIWTAIIDASGEWAVYVPQDQSRHVYLKSLTDPAREARLLHIHEEPISNILLGPKLEWIAIRGKETPTITVWSLDGIGGEPLRVFDGRGLMWMCNDETRIIEGGLLDGNPIAFVWDLGMPAGAEPPVLRWRRGSESLNGITIDPSGRWVAAGTIGMVPFWPLRVDPPVALLGYGGTIHDLEFTSEGQGLVIPVETATGDGSVYLQPIVGGGPARLLPSGGISAGGVAVDPRGRFAVVSGSPGGAAVCPLDGSEPTRLEGLPLRSLTSGLAFDPERELVAAGVFLGAAEQKVIGVWDLPKGTMRVLGPAEDAGEGFGGGYLRLEFLRDGSLISQTREGLLRRWNLDDGSSEALFDETCGLLGVIQDSNTALVGCEAGDGEANFLAVDFATNEINHLEGLQQKLSDVSGGAVSPQGNVIAVGLWDGTIKVRRLEGGEPHIFFGHEAQVFALNFSPDGRLLASAGQDGSVRVWTVPDLSKPPLHALPLAELLAKLDTHTNVRFVRDEHSATGWKLDIDTFPGWEDVPEW